MNRNDPSSLSTLHAHLRLQTVETMIDAICKHVDQLSVLTQTQTQTQIPSQSLSQALYKTPSLIPATIIDETSVFGGAMSCLPFFLDTINDPLLFPCIPTMVRCFVKNVLIALVSIIAIKILYNVFCDILDIHHQTQDIIEVTCAIPPVATTESSRINTKEKTESTEREIETQGPEEK